MTRKRQIFTHVPGRRDFRAHRVRLSGSGLSVGEDGGVALLLQEGHHGRLHGLLESPLLRAILVQDLVKLEAFVEVDKYLKRTRMSS